MLLHPINIWIFKRFRHPTLPGLTSGNDLCPFDPSSIWSLHFLYGFLDICRWLVLFAMICLIDSLGGRGRFVCFFFFLKTVKEEGSGKKMAAINQTFFISHGSPTLAIDDSLEARQFLKGFKEQIFGLRPKGIVMVSAHWDTSEPSVTTSSGNYDTIHDFYGFPKPMYQVCLITSLLLLSLLSN